MPWFRESPADEIFNLTPEQFEQVIAELFNKFGCVGELTARTGDFDDAVADLREKTLRAGFGGDSV